MGKDRWLCWGQARAKCRLQGSGRTFDEGGGVEVLAPRRKLPAGLLRIQRRTTGALSRGSKVAGFGSGSSS